MSKNIGKPKTEKCDNCFVVNNALRCMSCKYKTAEWLNKCLGKFPVIVNGNSDCFKSREGEK